MRKQPRQLKRTEMATSPDTTGSLSPGKILVVEDEDRFRENIKELLCQEGFNVETAENGKFAIQKIKEEFFHVVITDLMMPEIDGHQLLQLLKVHSPSTQVVVITAHASMKSAIEAMRFGAYDYLSKPFDFSLLKITVDRAFEKIRIEEELLQANKLSAAMELAGATAHNLNQPLTVIISSSEILMKNIQDSDPTHRHLSKINQEAHKMAEIIKKLATITKYRTTDYVEGVAIVDIEET